MTDSRPVIENSDRGITLNKQLAWTIGGGLIGAGRMTDRPVIENSDRGLI